MRLFGLRPLFRVTESGLKSWDKFPVSRYVSGRVSRKARTTLAGAQQRGEPAAQKDLPQGWGFFMSDICTSSLLPVATVAHSLSDKAPS